MTGNPPSAEPTTMNNMPTLFDTIERPHVALPRHPTDTQSAAAASTLPRSGTQRRRVYDLLAAGVGLTDEEMQDTLGMNPSTQRPRRGELVTAGLVVASDARRRTRSGDLAIVWRLA